MSEHSTEELTRQLDEAVSRRVEAERREHDARIRYHIRLAEDALAEYAAQGITPGCLVVAVYRDWHGEVTRTPATFLGVEVQYGRVATRLAGVKGDGSPSKARRSIAFDRLDLAEAPQS